MKYLYWPLDFGWGLLGKASVDKNGPESIMPNTKQQQPVGTATGVK